MFNLYHFLTYRHIEYTDHQQFQNKNQYEPLKTVLNQWSICVHEAACTWGENTAESLWRIKGRRQRGKLKGEKASQGPRWREKQQYHVHLEEVGEKARIRQSHGREAGSSAEREKEAWNQERKSKWDYLKEVEDNERSIFEKWTKKSGRLSMNRTGVRNQALLMLWILLKQIFSSAFSSSRKTFKCSSVCTQLLTFSSSSCLMHMCINYPTGGTWLWLELKDYWKKLEQKKKPEEKQMHQSYINVHQSRREKMIKLSSCIWKTCDRMWGSYYIPYLLH